MPEGHTLHRFANQHSKLLVGHQVNASSPQGRFVAGAALIDGTTVKRVEANGKHLFYSFDGLREKLHVHLGLFGKFFTGSIPPPEPKGALRLRLITDEAWIDLRGATACELLEPAGVKAILARLGPDPLARAGSAGADPAKAWVKLHRSKAPIAGALMDQSVIAGIGNVYRAELLFRHRIDPYSPSNALTNELWLAMWADIVTLMKAGVKSGRIVTTLPADRSRLGSPVKRNDAHYVYRRQGLPCRRCETPVLMAELAARRLYWCPKDQVLGSESR